MPTTRAASALQSELKQTRPFRSPAQEALLAIQRTAAMQRHAMGALLESHDLSLEQYNVLRILRGAGEDGLPTLEIACRMIDPSPAITRLVDKLEGKGWLARERSTGDRRQVWCRISSAGLALLSQLDTATNDAEDRAMAGLKVAEQRLLIELLAKLRAGIVPAPPSSI